MPGTGPFSNVRVKSAHRWICQSAVVRRHSDLPDGPGYYSVKVVSPGKAVMPAIGGSEFIFGFIRQAFAKLFSASNRLIKSDKPHGLLLTWRKGLELCGEFPASSILSNRYLGLVKKK